MTTLFPMVLTLALALAPPARAGYDVDFKGATVTLLSADGRPLPCERVSVSFQAEEFTGYTRCDWFVPGFCARWETIGLMGRDRWAFKSRYVAPAADENGQVFIPAVEKRWLLPSRRRAKLEVHALWNQAYGHEQCRWAYSGGKRISRAPDRLECRSALTLEQWRERYPNICAR